MKFSCARKISVTQLEVATDLIITDSLGGSRAPVQTLVRNVTSISFGGAKAGELVDITRQIGDAYPWETITILAGVNDFLKASMIRGKRDLSQAAEDVIKAVQEFGRLHGMQPIDLYFLLPPERFFENVPAHKKTWPAFLKKVMQLYEELGDGKVTMMPIIQPTGLLRKRKDRFHHTSFELPQLYEDIGATIRLTRPSFKTSFDSIAVANVHDFGQVTMAAVEANGFPDFVPKFEDSDNAFAENLVLQVPSFLKKRTAREALC